MWETQQLLLVYKQTIICSKQYFFVDLILLHLLNNSFIPMTKERFAGHDAGVIEEQGHLPQLSSSFIHSTPNTFSERINFWQQNIKSMGRIYFDRPDLVKKAWNVEFLKIVEKS